VIAQIEGQNPVTRREVLGDRAPVAAGTEQSMQDRNRRPGTGFVGGKVERHAYSLSCRTKIRFHVELMRNTDEDG
jgi:hypothetical protein